MSEHTYDHETGCERWTMRNGMGRRVARVTVGCDDKPNRNSFIRRLWQFVRGGQHNAMENK